MEKYAIQEGYIEELSKMFYLDNAVLKSSESVLSETYNTDQKLCNQANYKLEGSLVAK